MTNIVDIRDINIFIQHIPQATSGEPEELARADIYALLANLFYGPPTAELLAVIAGASMAADEEDMLPDTAPLRQTWRDLQKAAAGADPRKVEAEYEALFIGVGKALVFPYGSYYLAGFLNETPLATLREELWNMGFTLRDSVSEPEDHISALCDVMRFFIIGSGGSVGQEGYTKNGAKGTAVLEMQRSFFQRHIQPWYAHFAADVAKAEEAGFYRAVTAFAKAFFDVEAQAFEID